MYDNMNDSINNVGIAEVEILSWKVKQGDVVNEFDDLCSVQSGFKKLIIK